MTRKLTEGPGAGYTINGKLMYDPKINSYEIAHQTKHVYEIACDIDAQLTVGTTAYSYYYGGQIDEFIPVKITGLVLESMVDEDIIIDEYEIRDCLDNIKFETIIGSGYSHTTFDGDLSTDNIKDNTYGSFYVLGIDMYITDRQIIDYIDDLVTGENISTWFESYDEDDEFIDDYNSMLDVEDEAEIDDNVAYVKKVTYKTDIDGTMDLIDEEIVWEREDY